MTGAVMLGAYWSLEARLEAFFSQSKIAWCLAELSLPLWDRRRCSIHVSWKLVDRQNHDFQFLRLSFQSFCSGNQGSKPAQRVGFSLLTLDECYFI